MRCFKGEDPFAWLLSQGGHFLRRAFRQLPKIMVRSSAGVDSPGSAEAALLPMARQKFGTRLRPALRQRHRTPQPLSRRTAPTTGSWRRNLSLRPRGPAISLSSFWVPSCLAKLIVRHLDWIDSNAWNPRFRAAMMALGSARQLIASRDTKISQFKRITLPIRLLPTPTKCRVGPFS